MIILFNLEKIRKCIKNIFNFNSISLEEEERIMATVKLNPGNCTYIIVTGSTLKELEQNVNDIIAQGWNADRFIGGPVPDSAGGYCQGILVCPGDAAKSISEVSV